MGGNYPDGNSNLGNADEPTLHYAQGGLPPREPEPTQPVTPRPPASGQEPDEWVTRDMPPVYYEPGVYGAPRHPRRPRQAEPQRSRGLLVVALSVLLLVALAAGTIYTVRRVIGSTSTTSTPGKVVLPTGCDTGTPCGVAYAYLTDYTGGKYAEMAALTSTASQQRFSDPQILRGNYKNGLDYITNRTANILDAASVESMTATPGKVKFQDAKHASIPAQIEMQSAIVGGIAVQITIPLISESGQWRVDWTPGLIFPQLDDTASDPTYTRAVHLFEQVGHRGTIYDSEGHVLAQDGANGVRTYPYGAVTAAVTGYVSVVTAQDIANDQNHYYQQGDVVGHAGLEEWGEQYLRPTKGGTLGIYSVNADGSLATQPVYTLATRAAANGDDIHTTLNLADQQSAYNALKAENTHTGGGVFGVDPTTGKVLVMASYPACDPNDFAQGNSANISACINNPVHPLLNYTLASPQPIGSVFKIVTLSAALTHNMSASQTFTCTGSYLVPGETKVRLDDKTTGHGTLTAPQALAPSCDVIFWKVAVQLGNKDPNILPTEARAFGYGSPVSVVGVPAEEESGGLVPDPQWLQTHESANWSPSDTANLGIGQGFFLATPAQITMASAAVGNNGVRLQPSLIEAINGADGSTVSSFQAKQVGTLPLSSDQLQTVQMAMVGTTRPPDGTSMSLFGHYSFLVAGKTGTSQTSKPKPDAWFTAYAPASKLSGPPVTPKIALTALQENAGPGDQYAGTVCKAVLDIALNVK